MTLSISDKQGGRWAVNAEGVDDFLVTDVRLSNIIDHVTYVANPSEVTDEIKEKIYYLMRAEEANADSLNWQPLEDKVDALRSGRLCFFHLEPVYGAQILMLAEVVALTSTSTSPS
ncbi:hypothetical protein GCM10027296_22990 [Chitinimonas naiadis]